MFAWVLNLRASCWGGVKIACEVISEPVRYSDAGDKTVMLNLTAEATMMASADDRLGAISSNNGFTTLQTQ